MMIWLIIGLIVLFSIGIVFGARIAAALVLILAGICLIAVLILIAYSLWSRHHAPSPPISKPIYHDFPGGSQVDTPVWKNDWCLQSC